jgi:DNA-directed RNA polymerase specialized sigma24 family protein
MYAALKYKKYNFDNNSNPFSYFTTIAFHAFINRIKKEKRHHEAVKNYREKMYEDIMSDPEICNGHIYVKPVGDSDSYSDD